MSRLKEMRTSKHITQKQLAEASSVSIRMIQYYEQGFKDIDRAEAITVFKLASALNCSMEDLLNVSK